MKRTNISDGTPWEPLIGYSRAVRVGDRVIVSSTAAVDQKGNVVFVGDIYQQSRYVIEKIKRALEQAGANVYDVVKTTIYLADISRWEEAARAHREAFGEVRPVNTILQVARLVDPRMLVEMEAEAVIGAKTE